MVANIAIFLYRCMHFYVNNPKTAAENPKIFCIFAAESDKNRNVIINSLYIYELILQQS